MGVGLLLFAILVAIPGTDMLNYIHLCLHAASSTLPFSKLYQDWSAKIQQEEALLVTPLSLLCGGLILGRLAPHYASRKSVLLSGAAMAVGILVVSLAFTWSNAVYETNSLAASEGGWIARMTAPISYLVRQTLWVAAWTAVCVLGSALGLRLRDRRPPASEKPSSGPTLRAVPR